MHRGDGWHKLAPRPEALTVRRSKTIGGRARFRLYPSCTPCSPSPAQLERHGPTEDSHVRVFEPFFGTNQPGKPGCSAYSQGSSPGSIRAANG